jgi:hypothetical protein
MKGSKFLFLIFVPALVSGVLLWQAQPSKRVLMTDDHPVVVDLQLPPDASALITDGAPVGTTVNVTEAPLGKPLSFTGDGKSGTVPLPPRQPKFAKDREPMVADKEGVDPRGEITPDFERGVCFMYQVAFGIGYVTIDGKQYDCR